MFCFILVVNDNYPRLNKDIKNLLLFYQKYKVLLIVYRNFYANVSDLIIYTIYPIPCQPISSHPSIHLSIHVITTIHSSIHPSIYIYLSLSFVNYWLP